MAPYNPHRTVWPSHLWPFGRCECCGKPTMYDCTVCGLCVTEANTNQGDNNMDTKLSIAFGRRTFPEDVQAVWGARLIFPNDLVWDRQDLDSHDDDAKQSLIAWLNGPNTGDGAIKKMRAILADTNKRYEISPDLGSGRGDDEAVIYEDDEGKIIGSPQSSGGYLYVCGWLKAHTKEG